MKPLKSALLIAALISFTAAFAQEKEKRSIDNIELFFSVRKFPYAPRMQANRPIPGIRYTHLFKNDLGISLSAEWVYSGNQYRPKTPPIGSHYKREFVAFSLDYFFPLFVSEKHRVYAPWAFIFRKGHEIYVLNDTINKVEFEQNNLEDYGFSFGLKYIYTPYKHWTLSIHPTFHRYLLFADKMDHLYDPGPSPEFVMIYGGIGYSF